MGVPPYARPKASSPILNPSFSRVASPNEDMVPANSTPKIGPACCGTW